MNQLKRHILPPTVALVLMVLGGCSNEPTFEVTGSVAGADGKTLYLEQEDLGGTQIVDSIVLNEKGTFKFKEALPEYPEFYRLRLDKQTIPFAVDSVNTALSINADAQSFATSYTVEGSPASAQIREVWLANLDANLKVSRLVQSLSDAIIDETTFVANRDSVLTDYKKFATQYIYSAPASSAAYYALFQQVNGQLIFNLYDSQDSKAFAAVANVMNAYFPENPRTKHLYDLALRSIAVIRQARAQASDLDQLADQVANAEMSEVGYIDFSLPQLDGTEISLSSVAQGYPTMLSFTTMSADWSGQYNRVMSSLHQEYSARGLRIYQVGLDSDNHIWRNSVANLPFLNVQDRHGIYSELVGLYNVDRLPTIYLISREGEIVNRVLSLEALPAQLEAIL